MRFRCGGGIHRAHSTLSVDHVPFPCQQVRLALARACSEEVLSEGNMLFCEHCNTRAEARKRMAISEAPEVLLLLVRAAGRRLGSDSREEFGRTRFAPVVKADCKDFYANRELDIPIQGGDGNCDHIEADTITSTITARYALVGAVLHAGISLNTGHYIAAARTMGPEGSPQSAKSPPWAIFDDDHTWTCSENEACSLFGGADAENEAKAASAAHPAMRRGSLHCDEDSGDARPVGVEASQRVFLKPGFQRSEFSPYLLWYERRS